jgi:DNA-directed RNA polymerase subunit RPC12/RpoP
MNITYRCPKCEATARAAIAEGDASVTCPHCSHSIQAPQGAIVEDRLQRCLVCPSKELFIRKNFPQRLGVAIVVVGFAVSCITWYFRLVIPTFGVLFATAGIDVLLYLLMGNALQCYRCQAHYSGVEELEGHSPFDLEVHERHRQETIRLKQSHAVDRSTA